MVKIYRFRVFRGGTGPLGKIGPHCQVACCDPPDTCLEKIPNRPRASYRRFRSVVPFRAITPEIPLHLLGMIAAIRLIRSIHPNEPEVSGVICAAFPRREDRTWAGFAVEISPGNHRHRERLRDLQ